MTFAETAENSSTPPSPKRRHRRHVDPAASLLAQGKPLVWLTGSSLVFCLLMISGMLSLIVYCGSITFWPTPVIRVELLDGTSYMGEVTREEKYVLSAEKIASLSGETKIAAEGLLQKSSDKLADRRLFRTGNFELTQTHFRWVEDYEIKANSEQNPPWALVLERIEWGRFYGEPSEFVSTTIREPSADEQELAAQLELLELNVFRLEEVEQTAIEPTLSSLRNRLHETRVRNVREFMDGFKDSQSTRVDFVLTDASIIKESDWREEQVVSSAQQVWASPQEAWNKFKEMHPLARGRAAQRGRHEKDELGEVNDRINDARLQVRGVEMARGIRLLDQAEEVVSLESQLKAINVDAELKSRLAQEIRKRNGANKELVAAVDKISTAIQEEIETQRAEPQQLLKSIQEQLAKHPPEVQATVAQFLKVNEMASSERQDIQRLVARLDDENNRHEIRLATASGQKSSIKIADIVIAYPANQLDWYGKMGVYAVRWREFLFDEPREANSEGGVFPAIVGTVVMTLFMSLAVVPFGVLAALYLREYAKSGPIVSVVRIAINNLAGVPSIVFGVFGLGFFCYIIGAFMDGGPKHAGFRPWPAPFWMGAVGALAMVAIAAFAFGLLGMATRSEDTTLKSRMRVIAILLWIAATILLIGILFFSPFFHGLYATRLPNPTFGKGGLLWASLTLSLLTLPVVIVATEEALSAVPNSMREGSYACGAGKWQTIRRIVLPQAAPGIMTGMILAMARGAGEVAPLMLVGAVKLAPELPWRLHRSFMHLGFHIYDLGFQSPNSEAAKPMVYTTTMLLILLIFSLNITAVWLRARLRKRFKGGQF